MTVSRLNFQVVDYVSEKKLHHFYIAEDQSIYLLSHKDAEKLKQWVDLCQQQLRQQLYWTQIDFVDEVIPLTEESQLTSC